MNVCGPGGERWSVDWAGCSVSVGDDCVEFGCCCD